MKRQLLMYLLTVTISASCFGQAVIDTVSIGPGYANQVWYSLENDEQGTAPKNDWTIAFDCGATGSSVLINSSNGVELWKYPGDTNDFSTVDTSGITGWPQLYNSDSSWSHGAFSRHQAGFDVGWGEYSVITHTVTGDSIYVIKLASGVYQKIWIQSLASGVYTFRHATLNNSMDMSHTLAKSTYTGKNFGYFHLGTHSAVDREPSTADWDLQFTQYITWIPVPYNVSGVLHNRGVTSAKAYPVNDPSTYTSYGSHPTQTAINTIGYDWKAYTGSWVIADSTVYFVKTAAGDIWKMIFTGFGGSANGEYIFSKEKLLSAGIADNGTAPFFKLYPNPAKDQLNVIADLSFNEPTTFELYNVAGAVVLKEQLIGNGMTSRVLDVSSLTSGMYVGVVRSNQGVTSVKLVIE